MRLTAAELEKHNAKVLEIAKIRCANSKMPGITVSYPDYVKSGQDKVQLALPCGVILDKKRKVNAMQVRTGAFTTSLAKEKTKYDHQLGDTFQDNTDYLPFDATLVAAEGGELIEKQNKTSNAVANIVTEEPVVYKNIKVIKNDLYTKGILDI